MCGRYNIIDDAATRALLESLDIPLRLNTRVNIAPTENVPVLINVESKISLHEMRWWLTPSWAPEISTQYSMFNARAENLDSSKAFKGPYHHRRSVVPASSFIEWRKSNEGNKQPYLVTPSSGCFAFAGLWDIWQRGGNYCESCTIITTEAVAGLKWLHHRMPLILDEEDIKPWLDPETDISTIDSIRCKSPQVNIQAYPVSSNLNNSRVKDPSYLDAIEDPIEISH